MGRRASIVGAAVVCAALVAASFLESIWGLLAHFAIIGTAFVSMLGWLVRSIGVARRDRPGRFEITGGGFTAGPVQPFAPFAVASIFVAGHTAAVAPSLLFGHHPAGALLVVPLLVLYAVLVTVAVVVAWRGWTVQLTPAGLVTADPRLPYRMIPWEAFAAGGPQRPPLHAGFHDRLLAGLHSVPA